MFGRRRDDEGGFAGLGELPPGASAGPSVEIGESPRPEAPPPRTGSVGPPRPKANRTGLGCSIVLAIFGVAIAGGMALFTNSSVDGGGMVAVPAGTPPVRTPGDPLATPAAPEPAATTPPRPSNANFLTARWFAAALERVRREAGPGTRVQILRVDAGKVWVVCGNREFSGVIRISMDGLARNETGAPLTSRLRLEDIDPRAPQRMLAALKRRGIGRSRVDYAAVLDFGGEARWSVFLKRQGAIPAQQFSAGADGRGLREVG